MASQSLYRKWRSQTFSDLVGQEPIVRTLCNAVREGRLAHAYLFCGPRGTGKTSAARLLAKAVNCANPHDGEPCNQCLSCREIAEGRSPDVIEIDAASNNSVDDIRELRGTVNMLTTGGHYKVYVVDEAHMLSTQAFNALLKTLEEPPPHVIFVLATTEAHKMLPTIVSRCQRFDFRRHTRRNIVARLQHVAEGEGLALEPAAADLLARAAQGGMRDALSLLDQAMAFCGSTITLDGVRAMLGLADSGAVRALVEDVAAGRSAEGLQLIHELVEAGADLRQLNSQIAECWRALVLARAGADVSRILDCGPEEAREYAELAGQFALDQLTACARVFAANDTPARGLPVPQLGLELSFLECVGIRLRGSGATGTLAQTTGRAAVPPAANPVPTKETRPSATAPIAPAESHPARPSPRPAAAAPSLEPAVEELDLFALDPADPADPALAPDDAFPPDVEPAPQAAPPSPLPVERGVGDEAPAGDALSDLLRSAQEQWELVKKVCKQKRATVAAYLNNARPVSIAPGDPPEIVLQADFDFHLKSLREAENRATVEWALQQVLSRPCRVRLELGSASGMKGSTRSGGAGSVSSRAAGSKHAEAASVPPGDAPRATGLPGARSSPHGAGNGNGHAANGLHEAPTGFAGESWQTLAAVPTSTIPAPTPEAAPADPAALEQAARADPVIQSILRTFPAQLSDVHALDPDEEG